MEHHSEGGKKGSGHGDAKRRENFAVATTATRRKTRQTPGYWSCNYPGNAIRLAGQAQNILLTA